MNKCLISYFLSGLLGSILFTLVYHFSLKKNSGLCALFAALPIMGLFGISCLSWTNSPSLKNILVFFIFAVLRRDFPYYTIKVSKRSIIKKDISCLLQLTV